MVQFERSGPKVLLIGSNYRFRATADNPLEKRAELDSFARPTLWGFDVAAEDGGKILVAGAAFLPRDILRVGEQLTQEKEGGYLPRRSDQIGVVCP